MLDRATGEQEAFPERQISDIRKEMQRIAGSGLIIRGTAVALRTVPGIRRPYIGSGITRS